MKNYYHRKEETVSGNAKIRLFQANSIEEAVKIVETNSRSIAVLDTGKKHEKIIVSFVACSKEGVLDILLDFLWYRKPNVSKKYCVPCFYIKTPEEGIYTFMLKSEIGFTAV